MIREAAPNVAITKKKKISQTNSRYPSATHILKILFCKIEIAEKIK